MYHYALTGLETALKKLTFEEAGHGEAQISHRDRPLLARTRSAIRFQGCEKRGLPGQLGTWRHELEGEGRVH